MTLFKFINFERLQETLESIQASLTNINRRLNPMAASLADIKTALDAQSDKLTALAARIEAQANSGAPDPAELQAIADELNVHNSQIDALDVPAALTAVDAAQPTT